METGRQEARTKAGIVRRGELERRTIPAAMYQGLYSPETAYASGLFGQRTKLASIPGFWSQFAQQLPGAAGAAIGGYYAGGQ